MIGATNTTDTINTIITINLNAYCADSTIYAEAEVGDETYFRRSGRIWSYGEEELFLLDIILIQKIFKRFHNVFLLSVYTPYKYLDIAAPGICRVFLSKAF